MTGQVMVLDVDGGRRLVDLAAPDGTLQQMFALMGCRWIETVGLSADLDMWLDEEGALTKQPANLYAWRIAQNLFYPLPCGPYLGTVVFARHDTEGEIVGLTDERIVWLTRFLRRRRTT